MNATPRRPESPRTTEETARQALKRMALRLAWRLDQPGADIITLAEQARQTGALVLAELREGVA